MRLNELIGHDFNDDVLDKNLDKNVEILGMTADSRNVLPGYMFAALPGSVVDGANFIGDAVNNGARLILAAPDVDFPDGFEIVLRNANPRRQLALLAQRFFKFAPPQIFAVTGTNGKTSVATFI
ncbi:MAG: Mur ligase domain-containing protein, partial [Pseudomonadota bacterium]|nr:Mur ligase domain-containing protein [Pseudomonadota bacterium]